MSSQAWLDEDGDEEEDEDRPLLSSNGSSSPRESVGSCTLVCSCACGTLAGILLRCLLGALPAPSHSALGTQSEPAGQGTWPAARSRATDDRSWPLMMGVISREIAGHARRQRLRAHYGQVPDVLVRFVVSEAMSEGEEPDLLGVPDGVGSSVTYKSLHYWLLVTTLYDARYYLKTDDVSPSRARAPHRCLWHSLTPPLAPSPASPPGNRMLCSAYHSCSTSSPPPTPRWRAARRPARRRSCWRVILTGAPSTCKSYRDTAGPRAPPTASM